MITECAVIGPFVTEQSTMGPYTVLIFESTLPQKRVEKGVIEKGRLQPAL